MFGKLKEKFRRLKEKPKVKYQEWREERKLAKSAREKLREAELKIEARKYIKKAKRAGVNLDEREAIALVKRESKPKISSVISKGFNLSIGGVSTQESKSKRNSKSKSKKKSRTIEEKSSSVVFGPILGTEFKFEPFEVFGEPLEIFGSSEPKKRKKKSKKKDSQFQIEIRINGDKSKSKSQSSSSKKNRKKRRGGGGRRPKYIWEDDWTL